MGNQGGMSLSVVSWVAVCVASGVQPRQGAQMAAEEPQVVAVLFSAHTVNLW